jgi:hypothetical protein
MENEVDNLTLYIDQVTGLIGSLSNSLRQMTLSALDMQALALSKKHQIERQIDKIDDLGTAMGKLIEFLNILVNCYITRHEETADYLKDLHETSGDSQKQESIIDEQTSRHI